MKKTYHQNGQVVWQVDWLLAGASDSVDELPPDGWEVGGVEVVVPLQDPHGFSQLGRVHAKLTTKLAECGNAWQRDDVGPFVECVSRDRKMELRSRGGQALFLDTMH